MEKITSPSHPCFEQWIDVVTTLDARRPRWESLATLWLRRLAVPAPATSAQDACQQVIVEAAGTLERRNAPYPSWNCDAFVNRLLYRICNNFLHAWPERAEPPGSSKIDRDLRLSAAVDRYAEPDATADSIMGGSEPAFFSHGRMVLEGLRKRNQLVVDESCRPYGSAERIYAIQQVWLDRTERGCLVDQSAWYPSGGSSLPVRALAQILIETAEDEAERSWWRWGGAPARKNRFVIRRFLVATGWPQFYEAMANHGWWTADIIWPRT